MFFRVVAISLLVGATACESTIDEAGTGGSAGGTTQPAATRFRGDYEVPVSAELAAAAVFPVDEMEWSTANGVASLSYALPRGLVGQSLRVDFSGPYDPAAAELHLTGEAGTAVCTASGNRISCYEEMYGLKPVQTDYAVVEAIAAAEYAGPVSDRIQVAQIFESDPIGIAGIHLDVPVAATEPGDDN